MRFLLRLFPRLATADRLRKVTYATWKQSWRVKAMLIETQVGCCKAARDGLMVCKMNFCKGQSYIFITEIDQLHGRLLDRGYFVRRKTCEHTGTITLEVHW